MSPEGYIHNLYGPKTDIWAFGIILYEMFVGTVPFINCRSEEELKYALRQPIKY
jgi:serine/threonine protein kinase